mmetsp:Transcript_39000/g.70414  ORF Transcript_39000/g.70414 Transcript_39000/m.70414 type:complete len:327 (+) Transcript_39000:93-1073(+)
MRSLHEGLALSSSSFSTADTSDHIADLWHMQRMLPCLAVLANVRKDRGSPQAADDLYPFQGRNRHMDHGPCRLRKDRLRLSEDRCLVALGGLSDLPEVQSSAQGLGQAADQRSSHLEAEGSSLLDLEVEHSYLAEDIQVEGIHREADIHLEEEDNLVVELHSTQEAAGNSPEVDSCLVEVHAERTSYGSASEWPSSPDPPFRPHSSHVWSRTLFSHLVSFSGRRHNFLPAGALHPLWWQNAQSPTLLYRDKSGSQAPTVRRSPLPPPHCPGLQCLRQKPCKGPTHREDSPHFHPSFWEWQSPWLMASTHLGSAEFPPLRSLRQQQI